MGSDAAKGGAREDRVDGPTPPKEVHGKTRRHKGLPRWTEKPRWFRVSDKIKNRPLL